ncbi:hypothetical protein PANT_15d00056 [Moesziomyces antarcticus T-34]|uniref:RING-type domain-containing protein n=1 Tax=Pseudozyma antarctica (strain T-34) TaxID=1151754 RepID=M9LXQ1_PSEA3|nr:hypothetical protein PANT_15d00056 [Moesziomyces antarcticus T-34]
MGCSICLDDFDQADGNERRATALACGHIFHYDCLTTWFYGPTRAPGYISPKRCPLCSISADPSKMVKLYPSDGDELTTYLSGQHLHEVVLLGSLGQHIPDADVDRSQHKELLGNLLDFTQALQQFAMAAHSFRHELTLKAGVKVRRLIQVLTTDSKELSLREFLRAVEALESATADTHKIKNDFELKSKQALDASNELARHKRKLDENKRLLDQHTEALRARQAQVETQSHHVNTLMQQVNETARQNEERARELEHRERQLRMREREMFEKVRKERIENKELMSHMAATTNAQRSVMQTQVSEALAKCQEAERQRDLAHTKSCELAAQLTQLTQRLRSHKRSAPAGEASRPSHQASHDARRIRALEARLASQTAQLEAAGIATPEHRLIRGRSARSAIELSSSSPAPDADDTPATPRDNAPSPSRTRKGKQRARLSLSVEPLNLDDEMDEALFPMPGLGALRTTRPPRPPLAANPPTANTAEDDEDGDDDTAHGTGASSRPLKTRLSPAAGSSRAMGLAGRMSRRRNAAAPGEFDWLTKSAALKLGPKHRPKH